MQKSYSLQDFLFQIIIQLLFIIFKFVMFTTLMANISEGEAFALREKLIHNHNAICTEAF